MPELADVALMDQELLAGIGNELSDEILWRARVRPDTCVQDLSDDRLDAIHRAMARVLELSMRRGRIPDDGRWLGAVRGQDRPRCPRCGHGIRTSQAGGRTAYWCPQCQGA